MEVYSQTLEITIISAEGLRNNKQKSVKRNTFVTVETDSQNVNTTKLDNKGGSYPAWNEKLYINLPMHVHFLTIDVKVSSTGNKVIGRARIPVSDFTGAYFPENYLHFLSYRLRDENGERNGIINLSIRMKAPMTNKVSNYSMSRMPQMNNPMTNKDSNNSMFRMPQINNPMSNKVSNGVVTGVPVWYRDHL